MTARVEALTTFMRKVGPLGIVAEEHLSYFTDLVDDAQYMESKMAIAVSSAGDAMDVYSALKSDQMNRTMEKLAVVTFIFTPSMYHRPPSATRIGLRRRARTHHSCNPIRRPTRAARASIDCIRRATDQDILCDKHNIACMSHAWHAVGVICGTAGMNVQVPFEGDKHPTFTAFYFILLTYAFITVGALYLFRHLVVD